MNATQSAQKPVREQFIQHLDEVYKMPHYFGKGDGDLYGDNPVRDRLVAALPGQGLEKLACEMQGNLLHGEGVMRMTTSGFAPFDRLMQEAFEQNDAAGLAKMLSNYGANGNSASAAKGLLDDMRVLARVRQEQKAANPYEQCYLC
ncbi:hypothetical protein J4206_02625 [Candidatus Woesearchaeota archaeon]|nr:hypothetical protein [Candidatus Woesearchaeota archaeon]